MVELTPFRAIRYDERRLGGDLSRVLAPPYDVLGPEDKERLLSRSEHNIVAVDLPHIPPKSAGPPPAYEKAARLLAEWMSEGALIVEKSPAIYVYHQRFTHEGHSYVRRMLFARLRLQPFSAAGILPHENTFGGPKEDRLALMRATRCQLSAIFGLYRDPDNAIGAVLEPVAQAAPRAAGTLDGVENRLWVLDDPVAIGRVIECMSDKRVYIADGHHRYGTALMYRDELGSRADLPRDHAAQLVMFVLASMDDPGCLILPYPRALGSITLEELLAAWADGVRPVDEEGAADLTLADASGRRVGVTFTRREVLAELAPGECPAWRKLDYAYLHRYLIDELLARRPGPSPAVHYLKSRDEAMDTARCESGVALLTRATPMAHLREVAESGGLMPQKSTFFYPKIATGLTLNPLQS